MAAVTFDVVRPDDLLIASFEVQGFELAPGPVLQRVIGEEARLTVRLPLQAVGEASFPADAVPNPAVEARTIAGDRARLCFRIPDSIRTMQLTMEQLLNWDDLLPLSVPIESQPRPPMPAETALEIPFRVFLTPHQTRWRHEPPAPAGTRRFALWNTRLLPGISQGSLRIAWSSDLFGAFRDFDLPLRPEHRVALAQSRAILIPERLALTALGADFRVDAETVEDALRRWEHVLRLGREQRVRAESRGFLYPFGHRATRTDFTERTFQHNPGARDRSAILVTRTVISIVESERTYTSRAWPFRSIKVAATSVETSPDESAVFEVPVLATDWGDQQHRLAVPAIFVTDTEDATLTAAEAAYGSRDVSAGGQAITYVSLADGGHTDNGSFPTERLRIATTRSMFSERIFEPRMDEASVWVEALQSIAADRARDAVTMFYSRNFIDFGLPAADPAKRFAELRVPVEVSAAARQFGGVAAPTFKLNALTAEHGLSCAPPPASSPSDLAGLLGGKLLGLVPLNDLIVPPAPPPKLLASSAEGRELRFFWSPELVAGGRLKMLATIPVAPAKKAEIVGTIFKVRLDFLGILALRFDSLTFRQTQGEAPKVEKVQARLEFLDDLRSLAKLAEELGKAAPGAPPGTHVSVTPTGIEAGFAATLPSVALGQFTLVNLALSATLHLRFNGAMSMEFGLSSREKPFLVSYSAFGGGGYFRLELEGAETATKGILRKVKLLEFSIQLGAVAEVDFVVARGAAHVLIGIAVRKEGQAGTRLSGFVRVFGEVEVLRLVTVSIDMIVTLSYQHPIATGRAEVTVMVQVLAFSKSVSFSVSRSFNLHSDLVREGPPGRARSARLTAGPANGFGDTVDLDDWSRYCAAFAA